MKSRGGHGVHDDGEDLQPLDVARPPGAAAASQTAAPANGRSFAAGPVVAALLVLMVIAGVVGFTVTSQVRSRNDFDQALANPAPLPQVTDPDEAVLGDLNLQQTDVSRRYTVGLIPNGESVSGATLDLCNGTFPSEALRTARRQVAAVDTASSVTISTEAVLYRRPADAAQAFAELRALKDNCPDRPVPSPTGGRALTTKLGPAPDRIWKAVANVERIAFDVNTTDNTGQDDHSIAVYLRRGRVLMGVYFGSADVTQPTVAGERSFEGITRVFASRMAELPTRVVEG